MVLVSLCLFTRASFEGLRKTTKTLGKFSSPESFTYNIEVLHQAKEPVWIFAQKQRQDLPLCK